MLKKAGFILLAAFLFIVEACQNNNSRMTVSPHQQVCVYDENTSCYRLNGFTQGTSYSIIYKYAGTDDFSLEIEQLILGFSKSLSNYDSSSVISRVNRNDSSVVLDSLFLSFVEKSLYIYEITDGAFDVTVAPIVNAWGFGFTDSASVTDEVIDGLLQTVGSDKLSYVDGHFRKTDTAVTLIGNAIAQGMSVDYVADFLEKKGVQDYMVEIGGELRTKGLNPKNEVWKIAVDKPVPGLEEREFFSVLALSGKALATSGNYRKYYDKGGQRFSHTIDPRTGYPVRHSLLSATVVADDCAEADALATAFMVMGLDSAKSFLGEHTEYNALLIYAVADSMAMYADEQMVKYME